MATQYFPEVSDRIHYEGPDSDNLLAFKYMMLSVWLRESLCASI